MGCSPYILIVAHLELFVKGFFNFFCQGRLLGGVALGDFHSVVALSPLDNDSIPQTTPECNRQNAQNRDKIFFNICATFLLTKLARHGIMEISARAHVGGPTKTATLFIAEAQGWRELISNFNFNFWGGEPRYFHFINVLQTTAGVEKTAEPSIIGG